MSWSFSQQKKTLLRRGFIFKPTERPYVPLKNGARNFRNSSPFKRLACFYVTITGDCERFTTLALKQVFLKTKTFCRKLECRFHTNLRCQKLMLIQIE